MVRNTRWWGAAAGCGGLAFLPTAAAQAQSAAVDTGDTAWLLVSTALVMLMTPGVAFFYGGMVHRKNVLGTMVQVFAVMALVSVLWIFIGYSLAFGPDVGGIIGNLDWAFLNNVSASDPNPAYAATVPHQAFMLFQMMFAIITPTLLLGAVAERMRFRSVLLFAGLWSLLVYAPLAHWVWAPGGWLRSLGALDFAGGLVVHIVSGVGGLAAALYLGKRHALPQERGAPNNLPLVLLGAALLWFGWFGFNAGSALGAGGLAVTAFAATHVAAAASALSWVAVEAWHKGKASALGLASGAVAGLVAVTPASGFVTPVAAVLLGLAAGALCYGAVQFKNRLGFDDTLDAWGIHGIGGTWGAIATGLFATVAVNAAGQTGLFATAAGGIGVNPGGLGLMGVQLLAVGVSWVFAFAGTWATLWVTDKVAGVRVPAHEEALGLDITQHGELGYAVCACPAHRPEEPLESFAKDPAATVASAGGPRGEHPEPDGSVQVA